MIGGGEGDRPADRTGRRDPGARPRGNRPRGGRPARHGGPAAGGAAHRRPRAARRRARPGQDARGQEPRRRAVAQVPAHPVHAGPAARRSHRHADLQPARRHRSPPSAARCSPTWCWPTRSTARRPRCSRRCSRPCRSKQVTLGDETHRARGAVPGAGHPEPDRAGGHLPAARGAERPLHAQGADRLPRARRGEGDPQARRARRRCPTLEAAGRAATRCSRRARRWSGVYVDDKIQEYVLDLVSATRRPRDFGLPLDTCIAFGASPRATLFLVRGAQALALLDGRALRAARGRQGASPPTCFATAFTSRTRRRPEGVDGEEVARRILEQVRVP